MKTNTLLATCLALGLASNLTLFAQGSAFTYQGKLQESASPANGTYDFRFRIASDSLGNNYVGSPFLTNAVPVNSGLFTVTLDFGNQFTGANRWLEIGVRTNGGVSYATLTPLQALTPAPYAVMANSASNLLGTLPAAQLSGALPSSQLAGTYSSAVTLNNAGNSFSGSGTGLTGLNASQLTSGTVPDARLSANIALRSGGNNFTGNQIVTSGNLGIGTTSPQAPLHVANSTTNAEALFSNTDDEPASLAFGTPYRTWQVGQNRPPDAFMAYDSFFIYDRNAAKTRMLINAAGNVGIGKTSPATALDVNGTITGTGFQGNGSGLTNLNWTSLATPPPGMVLIPGGSFTMGNSIGDADITDATTVTANVSAFYMDVNLVSLSQWQSVYYWATNHGYGFAHVGAGKAANHPVQTLDWYDCVKWCNARSEQAGKTPVYYTDAGFTTVYKTGEPTVYANWAARGYRLPTEAEWEKAARGGLSGQRFPWGNVISQNLANYYGNTTGLDYDLGPNGYNPIGSIGGTSPATSPVGAFAANGYGLYDMAGNVFEWCWDWYGTPYGQPTTTNPTGPAAGSDRVFRGGGWGNYATASRSADRRQTNPTYANNSVGFRAVLAPQ